MAGRRIGAWAGWLLAALLLYFFENNTGTRAVLVISLLVPLLSMGCAGMAARYCSVSLEAPERAAAGERIRCRVKLPAAGWRIGCTTVCVLAGRNGLTGEEFEAEIPVPPGGEAETEAVSGRCGCLTLAVTGIEVRDWFGLTRRVRQAAAEASVIIAPELYPVEIRKDPDAGPGTRDDGGNHRVAEDPEPGNMRLYIPGDNVRRIHWKLSEKMNETLIRESAPEALEMIALMLETEYPDGVDPEAMHEAARGLLSVSRAMAAEQIGHVVILVRDGEAVMTEVAGEDGFRQAEEQVLTAESGTGDGGIETIFQTLYPDIRFRRMIVFGGVRTEAPDPADAWIGI